ncbi:MAG: phosphoribosylglycinamide formyltransferase [Gemmatimonadales bacterium]
MAVRIAVLASGGGTNLQALIDYLVGQGDRASARIVVVGSNREGSRALDRARAATIPAEVFDASDDGSALLDLLDRYDAQLVVLAGYLKRIPPAIVNHYRGRILNVHPGLLPEFGGAGMYGAKVHAAVIAAGAAHTGVTVHLVDDELDHGPVIARWLVPVNRGDTTETLAARVLEVEHVVYPRVVEMVAALNERRFFADF